jgi:hypothetical protein
MATEFDKDGIVETDGGTEFGPGGVVERDAAAEEEPTFQSAWAKGSNIIIQPGLR